MSIVYKIMAWINDAKAVKNGRVGKRIRNRSILKIARKFMK